MKQLQRQLPTPPGREQKAEKPTAEIQGSERNPASLKEVAATSPCPGFVFLILSFLQMFSQKNEKSGLLHDSAYF